MQGPALAGHPGAELVGVWGRDPAKAGALAEALQVRPYAEVGGLIAEVDAIAVALPPYVQAPIALRAAQAGRHLLLDKPIALSPAEADAILAEVSSRHLASRGGGTSDTGTSGAPGLRGAHRPASNRLTVASMSICSASRPRGTTT